MTDNNRPYVLVFGLSIYDIFGFTDAAYCGYDSNPGRVKVSFGGVCRNIAENMGRVNIDTKLISVLGDDEKATAMMTHAKSHHFDMSESMIVKGASTPTYMAILDECGEMVSAIVDIKIADCVTREFVDEKAEHIRQAAYTVLGADQPEIIEHMVKQYAGQTKFVLDLVSAAKASKVKHLLPYFHTIKPNRYEAEELCGFPLKNHHDLRRAGAYFRSLGIEHIFITLDAEGVYYHNGQEEGIVRAGEVAVVNVTGAGDSFVAGITYGYMNGYSIQDTVKYAASMAIITISHEETIHPQMCHELVSDYMKKLVWEEVTF